MAEHISHDIITACKLGRDSDVLDMIKDGRDVSQRDKNGYMGLHWASFHGHYACIEALLTAKDRFDVNAIDNGGGTALMKASLKGNTPVVNLLLSNGANVNMKDNKGLLAIHFAAERGHAECITVLAGNQASVNDSANPLMFTPLHMAVQSNEAAACRELMELGGDVNCIDSSQRTPLMLSCCKGHVEIARLLLGKNARMNARDSHSRTALHYACKFGNPECVELLITSIAKFPNSNISVMDTANEEEEFRYIPLHYVAEAMTQSGGPAPSEEDQERFHRCAEILVENGSEIESLATKFVTPLHIASDIGNTSVVQFLLRKGANPNAENKVGETPLHYALRQKHSSATSLLVTHGASLYAESYDGISPTQLMGLEEIIAIVFREVFNGSILEEDGKGFSILHYVCKWGQLEWLDRFLEGFSDEDKITKLFKNSENNPESHSPFTICVRAGNDELGASMLKHFFTGRNTKAIEILENEEYCGKNILHLIAEMKCYKTLETVLDLLVHEADDNKVTLLPELLNINEYGQKPPLYAYTDKVENYSRASPTLYHKLNSLGRSELTFHPVVNMLTEKKISVYGVWYFFALCGYLIYLLLLYSLLYTLAYAASPLPEFSAGQALLYFLLILSLFFDVACEIAEFFTISYRYFKRMPSLDYLEPGEIRTSGRKAGTDIEIYSWIDAMKKVKKFPRFFAFFSLFSTPRRFQGFFQLSKHIIVEYFLDVLNLLDLLGIFFTILFLILHFSSADAQWVVASLAYLFNTIRVAKFLRLFIYTGPYGYTVFRGLLSDFPKFLIVFLILLSAFTGSFTLALRGSFNSTILCSSSLEDSTLCNASQVFIHGIRVLLSQGEILANPNYFLALGFYPTLLSLLFVVFTAIFLLNILIASLTKTYDDTLQSPQQYKFKIAVEFETKSLLFLLLGKLIQPLTTIIKAKVSKDYWSRYLVLDTLLNTRKTEEMVYDLTLHVEKLEKQETEIIKELLMLRANTQPLTDAV